jgi:sirohydrochlorin cobaltochelatase
VRNSYLRIIVFPYFLFTGILVQRIYDATDEVATRHPEVEFLKAPYLNDHPMVIDTFEERVRQILTGDTAMNCQMCKYRTQVLGFENDVGAVQESHHHHVEGLSAIIKETARGKASHSHGHGHHHHHGHHHDHDHDHTHAPYPHADHPLGPKSLKKP